MADRFSQYHSIRCAIDRAREKTVGCVGEESRRAPERDRFDMHFTFEANSTNHETGLGTSSGEIGYSESHLPASSTG